MEAVPTELTIDILSRLPVKTVIHCKLVCKNWRNLVLEPLFVNLHLSRSPTSFIFLRNASFLVPPEVVDDRDERILEWVEIDEDHHHHYETILDLNMVPDFNCSRIYEIGSANGLIFLRLEPPPRLGSYRYDDDDTCIICNPVTREIIIIPSPSPKYNKQGFTITAYGFGVGSLTGEYKVVRTFRSKKDKETRAEVYTLGTGQWRSLGRIPYKLYRFDHVAVLNDHCHWLIVSDEDGPPENICAFDLNKESFQLFPLPSSGESPDDFTSLAVLNGCLCKCDAYVSQITIWVMKEYGIKESWHKEAVVTPEDLYFCPSWAKRSPIQGFKDGTTLFVSRRGGILRAFYPGGDRIEDLETFDRLEGGLAHRPSFLKLQSFEESEKVVTF